MIHLIKSGRNKFDLAVVRNGKLIFRTVQGYEKKAGVYKAIRSLGKEFVCLNTTFQDDTLDLPEVQYLPFKGRPYKIEGAKPKKKYEPK